MKKLQIKTADGWAFVFCRDQRRARVVTTSNKAAALPPAACWADDDLAYFRRYFPGEQFRLAETLADERHEKTA